MRLPWLAPALRRRRGNRGQRRRFTSALGVRRLERRRVLDAAIATMPAVVDPAQPLVVDEGTPVSATATSSGPAPYEFDWSLTDGMTTLQSGTDPTFNFVAPDDGAYEITVAVKDSNGQVMIDTQDVAVNNVAPQLVEPADVAIFENGTATLVTTISDPGASDLFSVQVNWQDGAVDAIAGLGLTDVTITLGASTYQWTGSTRELKLSHQYLDDGPSPGNGTAADNYSVTLLVRDEDGGVGAQQTATVTVENVAPQLSDPADIAISENGIATLTTTITDPGTLDVFGVDVNWQDGASDSITGLSLSDAAGTAGSTDYEWTAGTRVLKLSHKYLDDGPSPGNNTAEDALSVTLVARDDDLGVGTQQIATVTVKNIAPQLTDPSDVTIFEDGTAALITTVSDAGSLDVFSVDVNWQDGANDTITGLGLVDAAGTIGGTTYEWTAGSRQLKLTHKYLDDGTSPGNFTAQDDYAVTLLVHDDDAGAGDQQTAIVTVQNVAPQLSDPADVTISENGTAVLVTTISDPGTLDLFSMQVNWQDGAADAISGLGLTNLTVTVGATTFEWTASSRQLKLSHKYLDDGASPGNNTAQDDYAVSLLVGDDDTGMGELQTAVVTVQNVQPSVSLSTVAMISEHGSATLAGSYTDIGLLDGHTVTIAWDDPNEPANSTLTIPAIRDAAGTPILSVGNTYNSSTDGTVLTITSINAATGEVGFSVQHQYLDDGPAPGNNTDQDTSTILVTVTDDDTGIGTDSETVLVKNVEPIVSLSTVAMINEHGTATLAGSYTDIGLVDGHTVTIAWDDPNDAANSTFTILAIQDAAGTPTLSVGNTFNSSTDEAVLTITSINAATGEVGFSVQHQYLDDGLAPGNSTDQDTSTILVTVADDDMGMGTDSETVLVKNVQPSVSLSTVAMINEHGSATLAGSYTDIGLLDGHTVTVAWDDPNDSAASSFTIPAIRDAAGTPTLVVGNTFNSSTDAAVLTITSISATTGEVGFSVQHQYLDDGLAPGNNTDQDTSTILVTVADDDTGIGADSEIVLVKNVAPELMVVANQTRNEGQLLDLSGGNGAMSLSTFTDVGTLDLHKAQINWGDGHMEAGTIVQSAGSGLVVGSHIYADDGVYTVVVRLADDDMSSFHTPDSFNTGTNGVDYVERTFTVTVLNVAPSLTDVDPANVVNEGQAFVLPNLVGGSLPNLGVGLSDPGFDNPLNPTTPAIGDPFAETFTGFTIDWGDGTADTPVNVVMRDNGGENLPTTALFQHAAHTYADNGVYTVRIRVADDNMSGNFTTGTGGVDFIDLVFTITVNNVAPTLAAPAPSAATINENGSVSFSVSFADPGFDNPANDNTPPNGGELAETFSYDIDWGDGRQSVATVAVDATPGGVGIPSAGSFGGGHIYADDGVYTVTVTIHDDDAGAHSQQFVVVVNNINPAFVPNADGESFEGTDITSEGFTTVTVAYQDAGFDNTANPNASVLPNISDPRHESFTHVLDWSDGTIDAIHTYADAGVFTVSVSVAGPHLNGTFEIPGFNGNAQSVLTLVSSQLLNAPGAVPHTYQISWGDNVVQAVTLVVNQPGAPIAGSGLTKVMSALRTSGDEGVNTTGAFVVQHRYLGPPDPANPADDIPIAITVFDDNNGSIGDSILVPNPGINANFIAIDTTPKVPRLEFVPPPPAIVFLGQLSPSTQSLQSQEIRVARSEQNITTDLYLELVVVYPDGRKSPGYRLHTDALQDLRALFATLPDNLYQIYLVRTENNSRRLVMEVYVRHGRVVDPSDDSEGTRDRPPTSDQGQAPAVVPLEENPLLEKLPDSQEPNPQPPAEDSARIESGSTSEDTGCESVPDEQNAEAESTAHTQHFSRWPRWSPAAIGLGLAAGGWRGRVGAALESADRRSWQRLRRAARLGRRMSHADCPDPGQNSTEIEYNKQHTSPTRQRGR